MKLGGWLVFVLAALPAQAAAPAWLLADAALPPRAVAGEEGLEILRSETIITVSPKGAWQETHRDALRVEHSAGVARAVIGLPYVERADQVSAVAAWQVRAGKTVRTYGRRDWIDRAAADEVTLYSAFRMLLGVCAGAAVGDVFGGETVVQRSSNAGQDTVNFSPLLPARWQRLEIRVPKGWNVQLHWLNGRGPAPTPGTPPGTWVWEIRDWPGDRAEPWASEQPLLRAAVTVEPPPGKRPAALPALATWHDVATWMQELQEAQCDADTNLRETARRLTANAPDVWTKLQALARFVQERRYIMVNRNNGLGFGYQPRKATEVLAADYGDCKDKSNLLRALLREAGITSYLVAAYSGDRDAVRPDWPSPAQFNHAILMIAVPEGAAVPGAVVDPVYGRVLFFDSTDRWTPVGRLPWVLLGGQGLVCDQRTVALTELPAATAGDIFQAETSVRLTSKANGSCEGELTEICFGPLVAMNRAMDFEQGDKERRDRWVRRLNPALHGTTIRDLHTELAEDGSRFTSQVSFTAPALGQRQSNGGRLLRLDVLAHDLLPPFAETVRRHDVLVEPLHFKGEVSSDVEPGARIDLPAPRRLQGEFGSYAGHFERQGDRVSYRRELELRGQRVTPERYAAFRQFLLEVKKADRATVLVYPAGEK